MVISSVTKTSINVVASPTAAKKFKPLTVNKTKVNLQQPPTKSTFISSSSINSIEVSAIYCTALWRKVTTRKHKTWDGDGVLTLLGNDCTLQDANGKNITKTKTSFSSLSAGETFKMGSYEVEVDSPITKEDYMSGRVFMNSEVVQHYSNYNVATDKPATISGKHSSVSTVFKSPLTNQDNVSLSGKQHLNTPTPRHNPNSPQALVMPKPEARHGEQIVDVVVDPHVTQFLRPHQRLGVTFLYKCVMGMTEIAGTGAILADEMGLGKTLMTISLIWTLLKQNPVYGQQSVAKKVLVVCPVTLINNWKREFKKWLGPLRLSVFVANQKAQLKDFTKGKVYPVMIIGYEKLRLVQEELKDVKFDLVICDEAHRIKSATNKSAQALRSMQTNRRILLTGTPIQNDLSEFFAMIDFVMPGLFESYNRFKREFELPIVRSRQPEARKKDVELGKARSEELSKLTGAFVLRRTADILSKYLPPKNEFVVFCKPTRGQLDICQQLLNSAVMKSMIKSDDMSNHLRAITALKKICNSPQILRNQKDAENSFLDDVILTASNDPTSGKLQFLERFLEHLSITTDEKIVLVSSYTQTLDVLQDLLRRLGLSFLRLDGSTAMKKRQDLVDSFNRQGKEESFAFLLSAKSGGAGINLIGASRLVLFDTDWNPSVDLQAMARIHRDGQSKPVYIYRLLTTGCIDEKIYQRQLTKQGLADSLMDGKIGAAENSFTMDELRDLFTVHPHTICHTHDLLECMCTGKGETLRMRAESKDENENEEEEEEIEIDTVRWISAKNFMAGQKSQPTRLQAKSRLKALLDFSHIDPKTMLATNEEMREGIDSTNIGDIILQQSLGSVVSYVFRRIVQCTEVDKIAEHALH
ncbi:SNF2 family N-terminal domain-containing protein [Lipomyces japonicus]|uniref:SNF2 family N-terminal domain-containing protein n=1 Tax=Lipomyces japonicus TaxID=56871 RepID=UPI0034CF1A74